MGEDARQYLYDRGLDDEVLRHFQIGLAPAEGNFLYQSVSGKFSENIMAESGLFHISDMGTMYDAFQDRIMFPLSDDTGRVIAFLVDFGVNKPKGPSLRGNIRTVVVRSFLTRVMSCTI